MAIHVNIVSAEGAIFEGDADMVFAPAKAGELGIAPRHAPLITTLKPGSVRVQTGDSEKLFYVTGGILEIQPYLLTVLADSALHAEQLDEGWTWVIECRPRLPERKVEYATVRKGDGFYQVIERPWQVWLSDRTGLPVRVMMGFGSRGAYAYDIRDFVPGPAPVPAAWRTIFKGRLSVRSTLRLACDALDPARIAAIRGRIETRALEKLRVALATKAPALTAGIH